MVLFALCFAKAQYVLVLIGILAFLGIKDSSTSEKKLMRIKVKKLYALSSCICVKRKIFKDLNLFRAFSFSKVQGSYHAQPDKPIMQTDKTFTIFLYNWLAKEFGIHVFGLHGKNLTTRDVRYRIHKRYLLDRFSAVRMGCGHFSLNMHQRIACISERGEAENVTPLQKKRHG